MNYQESHYGWLERNFEKFLTKLGVGNPSAYFGYIVAHGDKCYSYKNAWEDDSIPFNHGVAIYLLSRIKPFNEGVRDHCGDVKCNVSEWVAEVYHEYSEILNSLD